MCWGRIFISGPSTEDRRVKVEQLASGPDDTTSMVSAEQLLPGTQYAQVLTMHSVVVLDISLTPFFFLLLCAENEPQMHTDPALSSSL